MKKVFLYFLLPIRFILLFLNMLILGSMHLILVLVLGYQNGTKFSLPWIWGHVFLAICGSRLQVKGKENIPSSQDRGVIFLFNHSSFLDIPALFASQRATFNFAAKEYTLKYPVLGFIMRAVKTIIIYKDRERSIEQYQKAEERLREGDRFMISPEGSRSDGREITEFKSGPFIFALNAKADLVPVVIYGVTPLWPREDKLPNMRAFFGKIVVHYMPKVSIAEFNEENRKEKAQDIRKSMQGLLDSELKK